jgi:hypothetical protein
MKLAEKKVIWNSSNLATFESKGESAPIKVNDVDSANIPLTSGTQLNVKVREEKNCAGKESDLLFTNKTVSESLSSDSYLESHGYNSDNNPECRPKSLLEDTEYDESENSNLGAGEEAINEPANAAVNVEASVDRSVRVCLRKKDADGGNQTLQNGKLTITKLYIRLCSHINKKRGWKDL